MPQTADVLIAPSVVATLLRQQVTLFEKLVELTEQQARFVVAGKTEALLSLLAHRQLHITELEKINLQLQPVRQKWEVWWAAVADEMRQQISPLVQRSEALLAQIIEADQHDQDKLVQAKADVSVQLGKMNKSTMAHKAYGLAGSASHPVYTDRSG